MSTTVLAPHGPPFILGANRGLPKPLQCSVKIPIFLRLKNGQAYVAGLSPLEGSSGLPRSSQSDHASSPPPPLVPAQAAAHILSEASGLIADQRTHRTSQYRSKKHRHRRRWRRPWHAAADSVGDRGFFLRLQDAVANHCELCAMIQTSLLVFAARVSCACTAARSAGRRSPTTRATR